MHTKLFLLSLLHRAEQQTYQQLTTLFSLMRQAIERYNSEEIEWHAFNGLNDLDILYLIAITDTDLSAHYHITVIDEVMNFIRYANKRSMH